MPDYLIRPDKGPAQAAIDSLLGKIEHIDALLDALVDSDVLPVLAAHYDQSGVKKRSGAAHDAITKRGAEGNIIEHHAGSIRVSSDDSVVPEIRWIIEGRGEVRPKFKKALHWQDEEGRDIFAKRSSPTPPHDIYYLDEADLAKIEADLSDMLLQEGTAH